MSTQDKVAGKARVRRERGSLSGGRSLLEVRGKEPGFHYAWINEGMVDAALDLGFEHVRHPVQVGTKRIDVSKMELGSHVVINVGASQKAFLMRQPLEFREEDEALDQQRADEQMAARIGDFNSNGLSGEIKAYATAGKK
jgi:hypothetical protein